MDDHAANDMMQRFGKAFFSRDATRLAEVITPDAQWLFAIGSDGPDGRVRQGVDGFLQGMRENDAMFERLKFTEVICRAFGQDQLVMTYLLDGQYRGGAAFALRGVELITVHEGRITRKDVFWKQAGPA